MSQKQAQSASVLSTSRREEPRERPTPASRRAAQRRRRLRLVFFALASAWGFAAGSVAVLAGLDSLDLPTAQNGIAFRLGVAAVVAVIGGIIVSLAYREVVRRGP